MTTENQSLLSCESETDVSKAAETHDAAWFDESFKYFEGNLPSDIRHFSEGFCKQFGVAGICDPAYVANVCAFELGRGDGRGEFFSASMENQEAFDKNLTRLVERLSHSYSSCVKQETSVLSGIARSTLKKF